MTFMTFFMHFIYCYTECHYAECRYADCHYAECKFYLVNSGQNQNQCNCHCRMEILYNRNECIFQPTNHRKSTKRA
jgi:hypothetical protein